MIVKRQLVQLILTRIVSELIEKLDEEVLKGFLDRLLDWLEALIMSTDTKLDDVTLLPLLKHVRDAFEIPDNNDQPKKSAAPQFFEMADGSSGVQFQQPSASAQPVAASGHR